MRTAGVLMVVALIGASASLALASPPASKGKPSQPGAVATDTGKPEGNRKPRTGEGCTPRVKVILKGALVTPPGEAGTSLALKVTRANALGRAYVAGSQPVTVTVDTKTIFRRQGAKTAASLLAGDRVVVQARACKADLVVPAGTSTAPALSGVPLTAVRVVAHPAKAADDGDSTSQPAN